MRKEYGFDYEGVVDIPFGDLLNDPKLVLRNLPRVETIELMDDLDYRVTTKPFVFHKGFNIKGVSHVNLDVVDGVIAWSRSQHHCDETCNGSIEGTANDNGDGRTFIQGRVGFKHPFINMLSWNFIKPMAEKVGEQFLQEFIQNFNDPAHENDVPEYA